MGFLWTATHQKVDKLGSGVTISAHSPFATPIWEGTAPKLATSCVGTCLSPPSIHNGWAPSAFGFAGFQFETKGGKADYGWIQLEYTLGSDGLANQVTVEDWAYDNTGAPITAGQTVSSSTVAMALLAAGAAGVAALRRRRKSTTHVAGTASVH